MSTKYEVVLVRKIDDEKMTLGYTARKSKTGLWNILENVPLDELYKFGVSDNDRVASKGRFYESERFVLKFSGNTEHDAIHAQALKICRY